LTDIGFLFGYLNENMVSLWILFWLILSINFWYKNTK